MKNKWVKCSKGEIELFNNREQWLKNDGVVDRILDTLSPHSEVYFSDLSPIFSFEISSLENLNLFSAIHFRDGVASLIDFFIKYPTPLSIRTKIYINHNLMTLAPEAWINNIIPIGLTSTKISKRNKCYFVVSDRLSISDENRIKYLIENGVKEFHILPTTFSPIEQKARGQIGAIFINQALDIQNKFEDIKFKFVSLDEIARRESHEFYIELSSEILCYCSDSYITHLLLGYGACFFEQKPNVNLGNINLIGPNYGFEIKENTWNKKASEQFWKLIQELGISSLDLSTLDKLNANLEDYLGSDITSVSKKYLQDIYPSYV